MEEGKKDAKVKIMGDLRKYVTKRKCRNNRQQGKREGEKMKTSNSSDKKTGKWKRGKKKQK